MKKIYSIILLTLVGTLMVEGPPLINVSSKRDEARKNFIFRDFNVPLGQLVWAGPQMAVIMKQEASTHPGRNSSQNGPSLHDAQSVLERVWKGTGQNEFRYLNIFICSGLDCTWIQGSLGGQSKGEDSYYGPQSFGDLLSVLPLIWTEGQVEIIVLFGLFVTVVGVGFYFYKICPCWNKDIKKGILQRYYGKTLLLEHTSGEKCLIGKFNFRIFKNYVIINLVQMAPWALPKPKRTSRTIWYDCEEELEDGTTTTDTDTEEEHEEEHAPTHPAPPRRPPGSRSHSRTGRRRHHHQHRHRHCRHSRKGPRIPMEAIPENVEEEKAVAATVTPPDPEVGQETVI